MFEGKTVLVTGGTGSFGHAFIKLLLGQENPEKIIVYSRDEKKQHDMRIAMADPRLQFIIGDVRDREQMFRSMKGVNYVFHAAALKQVPSCEFFPMEAVRTNVLGTNNMLDAADHHGIEKLVVLSTDKAVYPINAMGISKAMMEKVTMAKAKDASFGPVCCAVRYGNVLYSRGSVIPLFVQQIKAGKSLTITNPQMTRLLLPLSQAVELVTFALEQGQTGDLLVRKAPSATIQTVAQALLNLFDVTTEIQVVGVREGEKIHEVLVTSEELVHAQEWEDYYCIRAGLERDYDEYYTTGVHSSKFLKEGYTSANAYQLNVQETEELLLSLPEIQEELASWQAQRSNIRRAA